VAIHSGQHFWKGYLKTEVRETNCGSVGQIILPTFQESYQVCETPLKTGTNHDVYKRYGMTPIAFPFRIISLGMKIHLGQHF
jgi:hypothetical protein